MKNEQKAKNMTKGFLKEGLIKKSRIQELLIKAMEWKQQQLIDKACEAFCKCECCGDCGEHKTNCIILGEFKQTLLGKDLSQ